MKIAAEIHDTHGAQRGAAFHRLVWSNLAAQSAEQVSLAAAPIVAVLALDAGAGATGFLSAAQTLPFLLLSFPLGLLADRAPRRRLMILAEAARGLALLALPVLAAMGWLSVPVLAAIGFAAATGTVAFSVAAPALVPALVPRAGLAAANGRLELARSVAFSAGPAVAGALVSWAGGSIAFVLAAALSVLAVLFLAGVPEPPRPPLPARNLLRELHQGAAFAWRHRFLRPALFTAMIWNCSWFVLQAVYVPYAVHALGLGAAGIGTTLACYGAGMLAGAMLAPEVMRRLSFGTAISAGPVISVAAAGCMAATIWMPSAILAGAAFFLFGAGPLLWTIGQITLRQTVTPERLLGRVSALFMTGSTGARPVGAALGGAIGVACGLECAIIVSALGFVVQALMILGSPLARLRRVPDGEELPV